MSVRGMATNMVHVAMSATVINALALRNVGLADETSPALFVSSIDTLIVHLVGRLVSLCEETEFR